MYKKIAILAPGLLGASVAQAARRRGLAEQIRLWARRPETRVALQTRDWCDTVFSAPEEACAEAELVVVCAPVESIVPLVEKISGSLADGAIVTDVGSVKSRICRYSHEAVPTTASFVGSHPMAGSEKSGWQHADPDLFEGRPCFVTPLPDRTAPDAAEKVVRFWAALGAEVATVDPEAHDEIVANISHLPHVLASLLCSYLQLRKPAWKNYAGNGLKDTTRIASGSPDLWREILKQNQEEVLRAVRRFQDELQAFQAALANEDYFAVANFLERGKEFRDRLRPR